MNDLQTGYDKYQEAIHSQDTAEKEQLLNQVLQIYLAHSMQNPSGELLSNIGDVYLAFGQYGYAIAYYRKALERIPKNAQVMAKLEKAIHAARVEKDQIPQSFVDSLAFTFMSPRERGLVAVGMIVVTVIFATFAIFLRGHGFIYPFVISALASGLFILSWGLSVLFARQTGVIVVTSPLYSDASTSSQYSGIVLKAGEMVYIESLDTKQHTIEITTVSRVRGFIKDDAIMALRTGI